MHIIGLFVRFGLRSTALKCHLLSPVPQLLLHWNKPPPATLTWLCCAPYRTTTGTEEFYCISITSEGLNLIECGKKRPWNKVSEMNHSH